MIYLPLVAVHIFIRLRRAYGSVYYSEGGVYSGCVGSARYEAAPVPSLGTCDGDVVLTGKYFEVGMHRAGSLGTASAIDSPLAAAMPGAPLGMNSDYDRNGFDTYSTCGVVDPWYYYGGTPQEVCPKYVGDFVTPGAPVEGEF